ncbi:MAG: hypothetical protein JJ911_10620 [Rhizobiaceae bacterium]|nr:hypothetical protein [Rhizobiaceae bacterium]
MPGTVGILAFGSLIGGAGKEITPHITDRIICETPFEVEFARTSSRRDGAPTLVPYPESRRVNAEVLVLDLPLEEATDRLYRREIHAIGSAKRYKEPPVGHRNSVRVRSLSGFHGVDTVLYTEIGANISPLSAIELARLAIRSARARADGKDGITYLRDAVANNIRTSLSDAYQLKVLELTGGKDLDDAIAIARASSPVKAGEPPGTSSIENKLRLAENYLLAAKALAARNAAEAEVLFLLPSNQLVAHAAELLLKAMLEADGLHVPHSHDLVDLRHLLMGEGHRLADRLEFVVKHLGPLHAGHVFRYGAGDHGIPTAMQMVERLEPELKTFRHALSTKETR